MKFLTGFLLVMTAASLIFGFAGERKGPARKIEGKCRVKCGLNVVHVETHRGRHIATFPSDDFYIVFHHLGAYASSEEPETVSCRLSFDRGEAGLRIAAKVIEPDCVGIYMVTATGGTGQVYDGSLLAVFRKQDLARIHSYFNNLCPGKWYRIALEAEG